MKTLTQRISMLILSIMIVSTSINAQSVKIPGKAEKTVAKINKICKEHDLYKRVFTITDMKTITFKSESCVVKLPVQKIIEVAKAPSGKNFSVQFKTEKGDKSIDVDCSSFDEMTDLTSITITNEKAADELIKLFNKLFSSLK